MDQKIFIVEGNIGAGKSTFLRLMQEQLPVQLVCEPHEKWQHVHEDYNLLNAFYKDTQRWAYTFQTYAFITRIIEQQSKAKINPYDTQILERSVFSDRYCFAQNCFEMGTMSQLEWSLYQEWFAWLVDTYTQKPTGFIYLQTDPEVCYTRLTKRARQEEASVPLSYLQALHEKHENWLIHKKNIAPYLEKTPVLVLNCNNDFEADKAELQAHLDKIRTFISAVK